MPRRLKGRVVVVPASIGNLGPGFDTLGLALRLYLRVEIRDAVDDGRGRLVCRFHGGRPGAYNAIERGFGAGRRTGGPSLTVDVRSDIPQGAGLGSSAAATVAGMMLRDLADGETRRTRLELLADAFACEGHPDNAAAALFGGLTSCCVLAGGRVDVSRWRWPPAWRVVMATPRTALSTRDSRRTLPSEVPLTAAVFNLQRQARLLAAVRDADPRALREAMADRCHQPYRDALVPQLREVIELDHPDVLGVCLSGAGPSVAVVVERNVRKVADAVGAVYRRARVPCTVRALRVHQGTDS